MVSPNPDTGMLHISIVARATVKVREALNLPLASFFHGALTVPSPCSKNEIVVRAIAAQSFAVIVRSERPSVSCTAKGTFPKSVTVC